MQLGLTMLEDYQEIDPSPMASQQEKFFDEIENKSWRSKYERFCEENPWDPECKIFED